jgi:hypothetical protein
MAVGMNRIFRDNAAIAFTNAFYCALIRFNITRKLTSEVVENDFAWVGKELRMSFGESAGRPVLLHRQTQYVGRCI